VISKYLDGLRAAKGLSYQQVADIAKTVSYSTVYRICTGDCKNASLATLRKITMAVGGNMDDLIDAMESTEDAIENPESFGKGPDVPRGIEDRRRLATADDMNSIVNIFSTMLDNKDANYNRHIEALKKEMRASRVDQRAEYDECLEILKEKHKATIADLNAKHDKAIASKDKWINILFALCCLFVLFIMGVLIYDLTHPDIGFFRRIAEVFRMGHATV